MGYSSEGSIGSWGAKYRAYIGASTSNNTDTTCDVYLTGGGQLYLVDGWSGSSMSFSGKSSLSGNCAGGSGQASWSNSNWYYGSFKYGTINKTHSAQTLTYYCSFNFGGAGTVTASASVTISAKTSYTVSFNANSGSGAPSNQTKWHGETLTLSGTKPTRSGYDFLGWATSSTGTVAYSAGGSYTANSGATLYAVWKPQASTVTSVTDITLGNAPTVTWTPLLDTFKYKITYSIGSWSYTTDFIVPQSTDEQTYNSYTIPTTVANQITSASTGVITCLLETYDADDTLLGSNSKTFNATVPTTLKPTLTATLTPTGDNATVNSWGIYVAGYSKVRCQATGTAQQGASIVSVQITGTANANSTTSSIDYTTGVLTAGTKPFTFTVTDSRGMTSDPTTLNAVFMSYSAPEITSFTAQRRDAPNNTIVDALATWTWTEIGNNTITKTFQYRASTSETWTSVIGTITSGTPKQLSEVFTDSISYYLKLVITDSLNNASTVEVYIPTIFVWEHMPPNGAGVAWGKTSETGNFEINYDLEVYGDVDVLGDGTFGGDVTGDSGTFDTSTLGTASATTLSVATLDHTVSSAEYLNLARKLAFTYSSSETWEVGEFCVYDDDVYECTTEIATPEAFTPAHWLLLGTAIDIGSSHQGSGLLDFLHPVGEIFISIDEDFNPNTAWGGVWTLLEDTFLVGAGNDFDLGDIGGSTEHLHQYGVIYGTYYYANISEGSVGGAVDMQNGSDSTTLGTDSSIGNMTYNINNALSASNKSVSAGRRKSVGNTTKTNNLPPYTAVYMWQRIS